MQADYVTMVEDRPITSVINVKLKKLSGRTTGLGIKLLVSVCCLQLTETSVLLQVDRYITTIS